MKRATTELSMLNSYKKLTGYLFSMMCLFAVVSLQWGLGSIDQRLFSAVTDELFTVESETRDYQEDLISSGFSQADITAWLNSSVLNNIFVEQVCGDGTCVAPEEYPYFQGSDDMREFPGCLSDCGKALTKQVTVNFFDPWKLQAAYDQISNAKTDGWNSGDGNGLLDASKYTGYDVSPVAGWNVCSRNLKEFGFFDTVCLFNLRSSYHRRLLGKNLLILCLSIEMKMFNR